MKQLLATLACIVTAFAATDSSALDLKTLTTKALPDLPGKEATMIEVSYLPGDKEMEHQHDAHAFLYVLEGTIIMQVKGQPAVTLKAGETFYEGPKDIHVVGKNASDTAPARFVVVLLKKKNAPILTPIGAK